MPPRPSPRPTPRVQVATPPAPGLARGLAVASLAFLGLLGWAVLGNDMAPLRWVIILGAALLSAVPPVHRRLSQSLHRIRHPSARSLGWASLVIGIAATCYFIATAFAQGRDLFPKTEDDCSYLLGAQLLAHGRLWMPAHPLADFFDSFYILVRPVYCSIYFPGASLMFVPGVWLHGPTWLMPAIISGAAVGLLYRVTTELIDGVAGAIAALLMVSLTWLRTYSIISMSQVPMLLLGLLMIWTWLRWRKTQQFTWAVAFGALAGWGAITRPIDALCYAAPIALAMFVQTWRVRGRPKALALPLVMIGGAVPFLALQLVFDRGVTGHFFQTPYSFYLAQDQPGSDYGVRRFNPAWRAASPLPQKQEYYDWCKAYLVRHQPGNFLTPWVIPQKVNENVRPAYLAMIVDSTMPARLLLPLLAIGLVALRDARIRLVWLTLPLFIYLYLFNPFFLEHYALVVVPAVVIGILLGVKELAATFPSHSSRVETVLATALMAVAVTALWEVKRFMPMAGQPTTDETFVSPLLSALNEQLIPQVDRPALILCRHEPGDNFFAEPVYNPDVPWPDDAAVIRAHDLGARDAEIIDYYARRSPNRSFYLFYFDPKTNAAVAVPLGTAASLAEALHHGRGLDSLIHLTR